ncbi:MAG: hypothetical protein IIA45_10315 [Bacteroidetes bacterium]|nr:hypothetical protein [Bacteroidota bacterium]
MAETTPPKPKKLSTRRVIYTVVIIVLLAANGGLVVKNLQTLREKKVISETLAITDSIKVELEIKVQEILAELATYEGKSYELDSLLNLANLEVSAKQQEIERLLDENATVHVLRRKVAEFNSVRNNLLAQIDSFSTIIEQLKSEKLTLQQTIESEKSYSQQLEEEKEILAKKVELGSIIGALNIISRGLREKGSGKFVTTTSAKKAMRFEICFDLAENKVADQGEKISCW